MDRRLATIKILASNSNEGDVFFYEVSSNPVVSLYVTTGKDKPGTNNIKEIHLAYVYEPSSYPKLDLSVKTLTDVGFETFDTLQRDINPKICLEGYKIKFDSICKDINSAIKQYHGIKCYEDGDSSNATTTNVIILHIYDAINIMSSQLKNIIPELIVATKLLGSADDRISKELEISFLSSDNKEFVLVHIDLFIRFYAYLGNFSFVPIRTKVNMDSDTFKISSFFTNDNHFIKHQKGKLLAFNQNEEKIFTKMVYRSI